MTKNQRNGVLYKQKDTYLMKTFSDSLLRYYIGYKRPYTAEVEFGAPFIQVHEMKVFIPEIEKKILTEFQ